MDLPEHFIGKRIICPDLDDDNEEKNLEKIQLQKDKFAEFINSDDFKTACDYIFFNAFRKRDLKNCNLSLTNNDDSLGVFNNYLEFLTDDQLKIEYKNYKNAAWTLVSPVSSWSRTKYVDELGNAHIAVNNFINTLVRSKNFDENVSDDSVLDSIKKLKSKKKSNNKFSDKNLLSSDAESSDKESSTPPPVINNNNIPKSVPVSHDPVILINKNKRNFSSMQESDIYIEKLHKEIKYLRNNNKRRKPNFTKENLLNKVKDCFFIFLSFPPFFLKISQFNLLI